MLLFASTLHRTDHRSCGDTSATTHGGVVHPAAAPADLPAVAIPEGDGMTTQAFESSVWEQLGVEPVINACGIYTHLGGSTLSPEIWKRLEAVNAPSPR